MLKTNNKKLVFGTDLKMGVRISSETHLCAISRSSFVSTLASDVIPATLQAKSLKK